MFRPRRQLLLCGVISFLTAVHGSVWDYAPDFWNDAIPPYPDLKNPDGSNISVESLRGTHLFGWEGCDGDRPNVIKKAYDDFFTLANQLEVYNRIDWNGRAATDFWGPADGEYQIPDNTRAEILQIFKAAQQVYSYWWTWQPDWLGWRQLWIEVRCSDGHQGNGAPDPSNKCGDADPPSNTCPNGEAPVGGGSNRLQAFSDPDPDDGNHWFGRKYSRITFCTEFFRLPEFSVAIDNGKRLPAAQRTDLSVYDNHARVMFHEITHLDYFMNAGQDDKAKSPFVSDLEIYYTNQGQDDWHEAYGPFNARVLRNWVDDEPQYSGYYTQRNADNYAWFAMAKYVEGQIGTYPNRPSPGRRKPKQEPRDANTHGEPQFLSPTSAEGPQIDGDEQDAPSTPTWPGCGDKFGAQVDSDAIAASISSQWGQPTSTSTPPSGPAGQQVAIASYINPLADPSAWTRLIGYSKDKLSILVANIVNGPDTKVDPDWKKVIDQAAASGKTVIGYVRTGYLGVSQQQFQTRLGSTNLADWTAQIEEDVDMWYTLYGSSIGGIFFDEGWNDCGPDNIYANLYAYINRYTKSKYTGAYTVVNPGATMPQCFEHSMDTLLTFENSYTAYTTGYVDNGWTSSDARKIWHIIYDVPDSAVGTIAALALSRGAGMIEITNDVQPNPYDNLPSDSYMQAQLNAVAGGLPLVENVPSFPSGSAASAPGGLTVTGSDYSSAHLTWSPAANAVGYQVYSGSGVVASVTSAMTAVTIGNLQPGSTNTFTVAALGGGGAVSGHSNAVTVNTLSLPGGKTVINYSASPVAGSTTIKADILVPYAFVRVYIWDSLECDWDNNPGWPVNYDTADYVCTHYMVEGTTLFKYSGVTPPGFTNAPWSWTTVGSVPVDISGYTYTWTLPIGTSTTDTSKFLVQTQGYGPSLNVFQPDPSAYDCKGSGLCSSTVNFVSWCDQAANGLVRTDDLTYSTSSGKTGNCHGDSFAIGACGVFIQGSNGNDCAISGNDMWWAYQNIRKIGGCTKCGSFHRADGCLVTVNYVTGCQS